MKKFDLKKIIFYPTVWASVGFSAFLFYNFGNNILSKFVWLLISLVIQSGQIVILKDYLTKRLKSERQIALKIYLVITFFSLLATISFGMADINKTISSNAGLNAEIEAIDLQIKQKELLLTNFNKNDIYKRQIENLQNTTEGTAYWQNVLNKQVNELINKMNNGNDNVISNIIVLKKKRANIIKESSSLYDVFETLGETFFVGELWFRRIFLIFVASILEIFVYRLGSYRYKKRTKVKKKKLRISRKKEVKEYKAVKKLF